MILKKQLNLSLYLNNLMKYLFFLFISVLTLLQVKAQADVIEPVKWTSSFTQINENEVEVVFEATIAEGWSLYGQFIEGDGPIPTSVNYEGEIELIDEKAIELSSNRTEKHDEMFDMILVKYKDDLKLTQKITLNNNIKTINGYLEFMCCTDIQCIFPDPYKFTFNLKK